MYQRILVPLDGSPFAEAALSTARAIAERAGGELRLLFVYDPSDAHSESQAETECRRAEVWLEEVGRRVRESSPVRVSTVVRSGWTADEIVKEAGREADLVVMATHGRGPLSRAWLGSVADECIRRSERPILVVRPAESGMPEPPFGARRVVVPLDGSELSERALPHAFELADLLSAPVTLLRCAPSPVMGLSHPPMTDWMTVGLPDLLETMEVNLNEVAHRARARGIDAAVRIVVDQHPAHAILEAAREGSIVVMATHGSGGVRRTVLGSIADKVVRGAHGPVLVVRAGDRPEKKETGRSDSSARRPEAAGPA